MRVVVIDLTSTSLMYYLKGPSENAHILCGEEHNIIIASFLVVMVVVGGHPYHGVGVKLYRVKYLPSFQKHCACIIAYICVWKQTINWVINYYVLQI